MGKSKTALITGGAGFIGSHLLDKLVREGYTVRVVDNLSSGLVENIKGHLNGGEVEFVEGDIRDAALIRKCVNDVDVVVHLAALTSVPFSVQNPDLIFDVNVSGSLNLLYACIEAGVGRFVFASSCAVFGDPAFLPVNEKAPVNPISPYADSKLAVERSCRGFNNRGVLDSVVLRFFNVFGPRQGLSEYSGVITLFVDRCRRGLPLVVYGDGLQTRDFVSVFDVVEGIYAAMHRPKIKGEVFNIGSGKPTSINELAKTVLDLAGMTPPYALYKYNPASNSFIALDSVVDTSAKTIAVTVTSTTDPLFAIGGVAAAPTAMPTVTPTEVPTTISLAVWGQFVIIIELITLATVIMVGGYQKRPNTTARKST